MLQLLIKLFPLIIFLLGMVVNWHNPCNFYDRCESVFGKKIARILTAIFLATVLWSAWKLWVGVREFFGSGTPQSAVSFDPAYTETQSTPQPVQQAVEPDYKQMAYDELNQWNADWKNHKTPYPAEYQDAIDVIVKSIDEVDNIKQVDYLEAVIRAYYYNNKYDEALHVFDEVLLTRTHLESTISTEQYERLDNLYRAIAITTYVSHMEKMLDTNDYYHVNGMKVNELAKYVIKEIEKTKIVNSQKSKFIDIALTAYLQNIPIDDIDSMNDIVYQYTQLSCDDLEYGCQSYQDKLEYLKALQHFMEQVNVVLKRWQNLPSANQAMIESNMQLYLESLVEKRLIRDYAVGANTDDFNLYIAKLNSHVVYLTEIEQNIKWLTP